MSSSSWARSACKRCRASATVAYLEGSWSVRWGGQIRIEVHFRVVLRHLPRLVPCIPTFREGVLYLGLGLPNLDGALGVSRDVFKAEMRRLSVGAEGSHSLVIGEHRPSCHALWLRRFRLFCVFLSAPGTRLRFCFAPCSKCTIANVSLPRTCAVALRRSRDDLHRFSWRASM